MALIMVAWACDDAPVWFRGVNRRLLFEISSANSKQRSLPIEVFVPGKTFQTCLIYVGKFRSLPLLGAPLSSAWVATDKHSSLFVRNISDEGKKVLNC